MWGVGITCFVMLSGSKPFCDDDILSLMDAEVDFSSEVWSTVSDSAKDFIKQLLQKESQLRLSPGAALKHPWIVGHEMRSGGVTPQEIPVYGAEKLSSSCGISKLSGNVDSRTSSCEHLPKMAPLPNFLKNSGKKRNSSGSSPFFRFDSLCNSFYSSGHSDSDEFQKIYT